MAKGKCVYCKGPITEQSPSHYNCGCRKRPSPTTVSVSVVLSNDEYKKAIETIHHLSLHWEFMSEDDLKKSLQQVHECTTETVLAVEELKRNY